MNPTVSITIPCRNEEVYIEKCILSILNSNYPLELITVFVCDGMSDDNTRGIVENITKKHINVFLIDNLKKTTPFALNLGLKESDADLKIILGAHAEIDVNFINENVKAFEVDINIGCTGGVIQNVYENETAETIGLAMSSSFGVGNAHFRTGNKDGFVDTVAFGAYKKEVFEQIGYFDEDLVRNQDDEFNFRLLKNGFKIYLSNEIHSKYYVRASFSKLFKQYYQYGYWKVFVNTKHNTVTTVRQLVPLFFVLFLFLGGVLSFLYPFLLLGFSIVLLIYLFMALSSAILQTKNIRSIFLLSFTFFELHLSYGLGYLIGIFDFVFLKKKPSDKSKSLSR
ncbi:MAG: glycosyltransferase family 2 protein [Flavobacteriales bacterium]